MSAQEKFRWLISGIAAVLIVATAIGWILGRRVKSEHGRAVVENLNARIRAWWIMVTVFGVAYLLGKPATIIMFSLVSFFALREFLSIAPTHARDYPALSLAFFVIIPVQYYLIWIEWYGVFSIFIPVYMFLLLPALGVIGQETDQFLERCARIQWGTMVTVYCISHVPALLMLEIYGFPGQNALLLFYLLLVLQMSDVLQYVFGKLFGRTKIASVVSPSKTVEGFIGGGAAAVLLGTAMWWITPFSPVQAGAMSAVIVVLGFLGGLVLSAVKRSLGAKDWGTMIKGHGGIMDRMDSVAFAAPVFFHLTRFFFANLSK